MLLKHNKGERMKKELKLKVLKNQVIDIIGKEKLDPFEKAEIITEYYTKLKVSGRELSRRLGVSKYVIERELKFKKLVDERPELILEARRKDMPIERLKRWNSQAGANNTILKTMVRKHAHRPTTEGEQIISEIRDENKRYEHFERFLFVFEKDLEEYVSDLGEVPKKFYSNLHSKIDGVILTLEELKKRLI